jgi:hypothetical protein
MPNPIDTAPRDGTVILTDDGFALYMDSKLWGSPVNSGWVSCFPDGKVFDCADNGSYYCSPKLWEPVPEWCK